jgi:imidazoleglycerol phosphate dehydratase HisB
MGPTQTGARVELAAEGSASVATGLPVLDHLVAELARTGRLRLTLEVSPGSADEEASAAGRALGGALAGPLRSARAAGAGWAFLPAAEALAGAALEIAEEPIVASNAAFSGQLVGGVESDVVSGFLRELAEAAGLNLHVRVLEGKDPEHVLAAIFKALGAALGQACRPPSGAGVGTG